MSHRELTALIAQIKQLEKVEVSALVRLLGTPLVQVGPSDRFTEFRAAAGTSAFQDAWARLDLARGFGVLRLTPHTPAPRLDQLEVRSNPNSFVLEVNPHIPPHGVNTYVESIRKGALEVRYAFPSGSTDLREVIASWQAVKIAQGEEPVFHSAPERIYLRSYDSVNEVLEYACATRAWRILSRDEFSALGRPEAFGAFARGVPAKSGAGELMGGVFATPDGPAIVAGSKRALVQPVKTQARIDELPEGRRRFSLTRGGSHELELIYEERHGVGANPYDVEESDVDLFVAIRDGLKREGWIAAYTRQWPA